MIRDTDDLRGIWQTRSGYFVKVEKRGFLEHLGFRGYIGHEIKLDGTEEPGWIYWTIQGNGRSKEWDLIIRKTESSEHATPGSKVILWPKEQGFPDR